MTPVHYSAFIAYRLHRSVTAILGVAVSAVSFNGTGFNTFRVQYRGAWHEVSVRPVEVAE